jgi:hypothetical protein
VHTNLSYFGPSTKPMKMPPAPAATDPPSAFSLALLPSPKATVANLRLSQAPAAPVQVVAPPVATPAINISYQIDLKLI